MNSRTSSTVIVLLLLVIAVLGWLLSTKSAEAPSTNEVAVPVNSNTEVPGNVQTPPTAKPPLSKQVQILSPKANESVGKKFTVTGKAPGNWFFEGSAPIQVRDSETSKIFQGVAKVSGDWMTTKLVPFSADIIIQGYSGNATLVFLRDNPSGMPENDDSVELPIKIQ